MKRPTDLQGEKMLRKTQEVSKYDRLHVVPHGRTFADELALMTQYAEPTTVTRLPITPEMAEVMLARNDTNRPMSTRTVREYARQMGNSDWHYTRVPVIFSRSGRLIDGQHRLRAVIESGKTVEMDIAFCADDAAFSFIDQGKKRSASDIFSINGVANATTMAAALRWVLSYETGTLGSSGANWIGTPAELFRHYAQHQDLQKSYTPGRRFADNRLAPPSLMTAAHYICAQKNRGVADEFFLAVAEGVNLSKGDPALALRNRLIANVMADDKMTGRRILGLTFRAWNNMRSGVPATILKFRDGDTVPKVR